MGLGVREPSGKDWASIALTQGLHTPAVYALLQGSAEPSASTD